MARSTLNIVMWYIAEALLDPHDSANLPGVVHVLTKDYLGNTHKLLDDTDLVGLATHCRTAYGDVEIVEGRINHDGGVQHWTVWCQYFVVATQEYFEAMDDMAYVGARHMRLVHNCLYYRLSTPKPPITPKVLINTIFAAKSHIATRASDVPFSTLILLARTICSELVLKDTDSTDHCPVEAIASIEYVDLVYKPGFYEYFNKATQERYPADSVTQQYVPLEGSSDQVRVKTHAEVIVPPWSNITIDLGFSFYDSQSSPIDDYYVTVNVSRKQLTVGVPRHLNSTCTPIRIQLRNHSSEPVKVPASTVLCMIGEQRGMPERSKSDNCNTMTSPDTMSGYTENQSMQPGLGYQMAAPQQPALRYQIPVRPYDLFKVTNPLLATTNVVAQGCKLFSYSPESKTVKFTMDAVVPPEYIQTGLMQLLQPEIMEFESQPGVWITAGEEVDLTQSLKSTTQFGSTIDLGTGYSDYSYVEGMLASDLILEYRTNVGKHNKDRNSCIPRDGPSGYGITYLRVGIPAKLVETIVGFLREAYKFDVTTDSVGILERGYYWQQFNLKPDALAIHANVGNSTAKYTLGHVMSAVHKNLIGDGHLNPKLAQGAVQPWTTNIGPPPIGGVKSAGPIAGSAPIKDQALVNVLRTVSHSSGNNVGSSAPASGGQAPWSAGAFSAPQVQQNPVIASRNYGAVLTKPASPADSVLKSAHDLATVEIPLPMTATAPETVDITPPL
ncbi:hypothetical protein BDK51DRAFT_41768 [Blyttiomyces helicus]|uniref:Uncharacterized protein n=1 Tax=Blyttiomyces helicus TaxID=388810 RepID=A0A4P9WBX3_9FUNG|nr:hypothetical protein BDK51DRAFT_41768 [Blyttiomyces helicus]|eukprot:RKO89994.1 hypothetical protein BDK51DRAFT_41768 [Blyttiomyces helicus]